MVSLAALLVWGEATWCPVCVLSGRGSRGGVSCCGGTLWGQCPGGPCRADHNGTAYTGGQGTGDVDSGHLTADRVSMQAPDSRHPPGHSATATRRPLHCACVSRLRMRVSSIRCVPQGRGICAVLPIGLH